MLSRSLPVREKGIPSKMINTEFPIITSFAFWVVLLIAHCCLKILNGNFQKKIVSLKSHTVL